jgi:hypothetical protein
MEDPLERAAALVPYREEIRMVPMGPELGPAYTAFEQEVTANLRQLSANGNISGFIPWLMALLIYPDMPWRGWECRMLRRELGTAPALPKQSIYPIEKALINYVQEQLNQHLPTLVFSENSEPLTNDQDRLKSLFEEHVVTASGDAPRVAILRNAVSWGQRQAWVDQRTCEEAVHVRICDPVRAADLQLAYFKRIAFKRIPLARKTLYQAARCLCTSGQDRGVETVFFVYEDSLALRLMHVRLQRILSGEQRALVEDDGAQGYSDDPKLMETARALFAAMDSG